MAAGVPVVSTAVGAEGLPVHHPDQIRLADRPEDFADECIRLLSDEGDRRLLGISGARVGDCELLPGMQRSSASSKFCSATGKSTLT